LGGKRGTRWAKQSNREVLLQDESTVGKVAYTRLTMLAKKPKSSAGASVSVQTKKNVGRAQGRCLAGQTGRETKSNVQTNEGTRKGGRVLKCPAEWGKAKVIGVGAESKRFLRQDGQLEVRQMMKKQGGLGGWGWGNTLEDGACRGR